MMWHVFDFSARLAMLRCWEICELRATLIAQQEQEYTHERAMEIRRLRWLAREQQEIVRYNLMRRAPNA